jgi:hypothetical protein
LGIKGAACRMLLAHKDSKNILYQFPKVWYHLTCYFSGASKLVINQNFQMWLNMYYSQQWVTVTSYLQDWSSIFTHSVATLLESNTAVWPTLSKLNLFLHMLCQQQCWLK